MNLSTVYNFELIQSFLNSLDEHDYNECIHLGRVYPHTPADGQIVQITSDVSETSNYWKYDNNTGCWRLATSDEVIEYRDTNTILSAYAINNRLSGDIRDSYSLSFSYDDSVWEPSTLSPLTLQYGRKYGQLPSLTPKPENKAIFVGWKVNGKMISPNTVFYGTDDVTAYVESADIEKSFKLSFYDTGSKNIEIAAYNIQYQQKLETAISGNSHLSDDWETTLSSNNVTKAADTSATYSFAGWYLDEEKYELTTTYKFQQDTTLSSKFDANLCCIIDFDKNGGDGDVPGPTNAMVGDQYGTYIKNWPTVTYTNPTVKFDSWKIDTQPVLPDSTIDIGTAVLSNDKYYQHLVASWKFPEYIVSLDYQGGLPEYKHEIYLQSGDTYYDSLPTSSDITKTSGYITYDLSCWQLSSSSGIQNILSDTQVLTNEISHTISAYWVEHVITNTVSVINSFASPSSSTYTAYYGHPYSYDGTAVSRQIFDQDLTSSGYTFQGWFEIPNTTSSIATPISDDTIVNYMNNHAVYASWSKDEVKKTTVTLDPNSDYATVALDTIILLYQKQLPVLDANRLPVVFADYDKFLKFNGYYDLSDNQVYQSDGQAPTHSTSWNIVSSEYTLSGKWNKNGVIVYFDDGGGSSVNPYQVLYDSNNLKANVTIPPTNGGQRFLGYYRDSTQYYKEDGTKQQSVSDSILTSTTIYDITLSARYQTIDEYALQVNR